MCRSAPPRDHDVDSDSDAGSEDSSGFPRSMPQAARERFTTLESEYHIDLDRFYQRMRERRAKDTQAKRKMLTKALSKAAKSSAPGMSAEEHSALARAAKQYTTWSSKAADRKKIAAETSKQANKARTASDKKLREIRKAEWKMREEAMKSIRAKFTAKREAATAGYCKLRKAEERNERLFGTAQRKSDDARETLLSMVGWTPQPQEPEPDEPEELGRLRNEWFTDEYGYDRYDDYYW